MANLAMLAKQNRASATGATEEKLVTGRYIPSNKQLMERAFRQLRGFAAWPDIAMSQLLVASVLTWHKRGDLVSAGTPLPKILLVVEGHLMFSEGDIHSPRRLGMILRGPGDLLGFWHMLNAKERVLTYFAQTDALVIHVPGKTVFELLDEEPERWKEMSHFLLGKEREAMDLAAGQVVGAFKNRLGLTVHQLASLYGVRDASDHIHLRLTQHDLAEILCVSRQLVSEALKSWTSAGILQMEYNGIQVLDLKALAEPYPAVENQEGRSRENDGFAK